GALLASLFAQGVRSRGDRSARVRSDSGRSIFLCGERTSAETAGLYSRAVSARSGVGRNRIFPAVVAGENLRSAARRIGRFFEFWQGGQNRVFRKGSQTLPDSVGRVLGRGDRSALVRTEPGRSVFWGPIFWGFGRAGRRQSLR